MTVQELMSVLEGYAPGDEVKIAIQPSYPLIATISNVVSQWELDEEDGEDVDTTAPTTIYIATNAAGEYGSRNIWK